MDANCSVNLDEVCASWISNATDADVERWMKHDVIAARPSYGMVWGLGLSVVTFISLSAILGVGLMRVISKRTYSVFITFFVAVGVGSLSGSAVFHLLPQAYGLVDEKNPASGDLYLPKALTAVVGIYLFFIADKVIKIILETRKKSQHHANDEHLRQPMNVSDSNAPLFKPLVSTPPEMGSAIELKTLNSQAEASMEQQAHSICVHDHDMQYKAGDSVIGTVAWMIIFGDGLHNFIDGVSIGASFSESILSGLSVSVAVICEEFPHELGDVAILVSAGMTLRQALVYNVLSALTCYLGFLIGVFFGNLDPAFSTHIFAFAGGMFLYISMSCMIPEMKKAVEEGLQVSLKSGLQVLLLQSLGIFFGLTLMYIMARFGSAISLA